MTHAATCAAARAVPGRVQKPGSASIPIPRTAEQSTTTSNSKLHRQRSNCKLQRRQLARSMARLLPSAAVAVAIVLAASLPATWADSPAADDAPPYRNHTVGGADGWFFNANTNSTSGNYSDWANGETFYLGEYLLFKTNDNSSVVHTTNATTYNLCDPSDDLEPQTTTSIYGGGGGGGGGLEQNSTISVLLRVEGTNYFFSEADGGVQCQQGMRFEIKVEHGQGLPPSLKDPPPAPKGRVLAPPPAGTAFSGTGDVEPGDGAGDNGGAGRNGACRAAAAGGQLLGLAIVMSLAVLVAA